MSVEESHLQHNGSNHEIFSENPALYDENIPHHEGVVHQLSEKHTPLNSPQYTERKPEFLSQSSDISNNGSQHDGTLPEYVAQNSTSSFEERVFQHDERLPEFISQHSATSNDGISSQHEHSNMSIDENTISQQNGTKPEYNYSDYYSYLLKNPWIQQAIATYDWTKHSNRLLESTLDRVEYGVSTVAQTAAEKAADVHQNYIMRPKEAVASAYNTGKEKTMNAVETSKNLAIQGGTVGLGAAVVATQIGLALSAGGANLVINTIGGVHHVGQRVLASVCEAEKAMEEKIWAAIAEGQRVAQIKIEDVPESSVRDRVKRIASKTVEALSSKARIVLNPVSAQLHGLIEQLNKSFILVDLVREKREWAQGKVDELSSSVAELKTRLENEARQLKTKPEELLMKSIRGTSVQLRNNLERLKGNGQRVFGDVGRVESAINYLHNLDKNLGESNDIYQVRDEVLSEARQRLAELTAWTSSLLSKEKSQ
ncbi:unnamed protein product [Cylicocyclus nassatus]|uniref:Uncharacterized protein n=1 Tax=Cylicocyclus nassatus TaxID=53992 RepID=A0AA36M229_CYLNA|nr:unnamed protein product [Cylicocyclus nassatus]